MGIRVETCNAMSAKFWFKLVVSIRNDQICKIYWRHVVEQKRQNHLMNGEKPRNQRKVYADMFQLIEHFETKYLVARSTTDMKEKILVLYRHHRCISYNLFEIWNKSGSTLKSRRFAPCVPVGYLLVDKQENLPTVANLFSCKIN